jgi:ATP-dependent helicase HrpA
MSDYYDGIVSLIIDATFLQNNADVRSQQVFETLLLEYKNQLILTADEIQAQVLDLLQMYQQIQSRLTSKDIPHLMINDVQQQLAQLLYQGFLGQTPVQQLKQFPRYLKAITYRLEKALENSLRDERAINELQSVWNPYWKTVSETASHQEIPPAMDQFRWSLEEFRVSLFAQQLKTAYPVSKKRLEKQWSQRVAMRL